MCASSDDAEKRCKITAFHRNDQMSRTFSRRDCVRFRPWAASRGGMSGGSDARGSRSFGPRLPSCRLVVCMGAFVWPMDLWRRLWRDGRRPAKAWAAIAGDGGRRIVLRRGRLAGVRTPDCGEPRAGSPGRRDEAREPRGIVAGCVSGLPGDEAAPARPRHCPGRGFMMDVRPRPRRLPLLRRRTCGTAPHAGRPGRPDCPGRRGGLSLPR